MKTRISIDLDDDLYKRLKVHCALEKQTIADVVRKLLENYLPEAEKEIEEITRRKRIRQVPDTPNGP
jgi:metal-responsive CopG/Arc/MetJ family transcriptional regulator